MTNRISRGALFLLLLLLLASCDPLKPAQEEVAVRVGKQKITLDAIRKDVERISAEMGLKPGEVRPVFEPLVERLVDRYVLLAYGAEHGVAVEERELEAVVRDIKSDYPSEEAFRNTLFKRYVDFDTWEEELHEQLLLRKIIEQGMEGVQPVSFREIQERYEKRRDTYKHPAMVRFRQIVAQDAGTAREIIELVKQDRDLPTLIAEAPGRFEKIVGMPERWATENELEETLAEAVFSLPVGLSGKPVKTPYGHHVVEVTDRRPEGVMSLPEVMGRIEEELLAQKRESFYRNWIETLKTRYPVKVNREVLNRLEIG
ncbi:MAG: peptidyl-prolyl cis-trans isomerase [Deltaproteobacteria bacterium]|nr:peptidyl-prolyl cis-trans isomerase [Deltaproteobacteria bacterium]